MRFLRLRRPAFALVLVLGVLFAVRALGPHAVGAQDQTTTIGPVMVSSAVTPVKVNIAVLALPEAPPAAPLQGREVDQLITSPLVISPAMLATEQSKPINLRAQLGAPALGLAGVTPPEF